MKDAAVGGTEPINQIEKKHIDVQINVEFNNQMDSSTSK